MTFFLCALIYLRLIGKEPSPPPRGHEDAMNPGEVAVLAYQIFDVIENDLRDRRGLKHEWADIDDSVQKEIRATNQMKITKILWPLLGPDVEIDNE